MYLRQATCLGQDACFYIFIFKVRKINDNDNDIGDDDDEKAQSLNAQFVFSSFTSVSLLKNWLTFTYEQNRNSDTTVEAAGRKHLGIIFSKARWHGGIFMMFVRVLILKYGHMLHRPHFLK